ncbi:helix-turn-helix domain-containing protein [Pseudomonas sp. GW456-E7]|nr:helix-turn-helix domain-containing protein [Pseudomonas sp. GW456-E7]
MSIRAMNWAWGQPLSPTSKLILMALADAADDEGLCWPGIKTLAAKCSVSGRTVQRTVKTFVAQGLLLVEERRRPDGRQTSNSYLLALQRYPDNMSPSTLRTLGSGDTGDTGGVTKLRQGGCDSAVSPQEPPREHLKKPLQPRELCNQSAAIIFPRKLSAMERESIVSMARAIPVEDLQQLVDELASALASESTIRTTPLRWFQGVLRRYERGEFVAAGAIETAKRRLQKEKLKESEVISSAQIITAGAEPKHRRLRQVLSTKK